jgi:SAM-dependent methyltransferase
LYEEESFDVVNMTYVIEHVYSPRDVMEKAVSWLKPGGLLLVSSPNWGSMMAKWFRELYRLNDPCQHINLWDRKSLPEFTERFACKVKEVHFPYFATEYFNPYEVMRLVRNSMAVKLLPLSLLFGFAPKPDKVLSPPFWGNIMVVEAYKNNKSDGS